MKKLLGIVLFLGCVLECGTSLAESASVFNNYTPTKSMYDPRCKATSGCSTLQGYVTYRAKGCLQLKDNSSCTLAFCRGDCTKKDLMKEEFKDENVSNLSFQMEETCREVCSTVKLDKLEIEALGESGVFQKTHSLADQTKSRIEQQTKNERTKDEARSTQRVSKKFSKELGTFGLSGIAKLDAKRKWEQKWLNAYIGMYNKHIQYATSFYNQRIKKLRDALEAQEGEMKKNVEFIEKKYKNITIPNNLREKLTQYKRPLEIRQAECPPPCACTNDSCSMARPSAQPLKEEGPVQYGQTASLDEPVNGSRH